MPRQLLGTAIAANTITTTQLQTTVVNQISAGGGPRVSSLIYPGNDTAGNTVGGQTVYINGSGFETNNAIYINGNAVPSKSFISASNLSFTTPALSAGIYPVYVINTDTGATAIFVPGYISSGEPTWVSGTALADIGVSDPWSISLSATGDAPITYALANGSSLPSGISLAANGLISGTLSSQPESDTQYTFTVVASDAQNQDSSRQFTVTVSAGEGLPFANNVLLIHANGTNNQNNHTFLDSSTNGFTVTRGGNATQGSFSPFSQTGWSVYFDGTSDWLQITNNAALDFADVDFTLEMWLNFNRLPTSWENQMVMLSKGNDQGGGWSMSFGADGAAPGGYSIAIVAGASTQIKANFASTPKVGTWYHVAVSRSGSSGKIFIDGVQAGTASGTSWPSASSNDLRIGRMQRDDYPYWTHGYISNLRLIKGTALYTTNFTPPTAELTAVSNTTLLTCKNNRFNDSSNNNFSISRNGDVRVTPYSPFAPTVAYSTANVGGSVYLDGSGDYLTIPAGSAFAPGTGDFTFECWVYPLVSSSEQYIWAQTVSGTNYFLLGYDSSTGAVYMVMTASGGGTAINGPSGGLKILQWNHIAVSRVSGTVTVYVNGVGGTPGSNSLDLNNTSHVPTIGAYSHNLAYGNPTAYFSSMRYVKGTAVYTGNFTPPTTPPTNTANTSLLLNFTNAGIFDQTAKNVLETVGDAKVSTAQYKYGTGSIAFDGTGDYLEFLRTPNLQFGSGDFTAEAWVYLTTSSAATIFWIEGTNSAGGYAALRVGADSSQLYVLISTNNSSWAVSSGLVGSSILNQWVHVAVTRSGSNVRLFRNGTQIGTTYSLSGSVMTGTYNRIGYLFSSEPFVGYIDDLRITKGYARYTSNFTPPTSALKDK